MVKRVYKNECVSISIVLRLVLDSAKRKRRSNVFSIGYMVHVSSIPKRFLSIFMWMDNDGVCCRIVNAGVG